MVARGVTGAAVEFDRGVFSPDAPWGWKPAEHRPSTWDPLRVTPVVVLGAGLQLDIGGRALRGRVDLLALRGQPTQRSTPARASADLDASGGAPATASGELYSVESVGQPGSARRGSKQARPPGLPQPISLRFTPLLVRRAARGDGPAKGDRTRKKKDKGQGEGYE